MRLWQIALALAVLVTLSAGGQAEVVISGQVTWALTGDPIAGVDVTLNDGADGTTATDASGFYGFSGLDAGEYEITITRQSYADIVLPSTFYDDGVYDLDFVLENVQVDLPMIGYANLDGATAFDAMIVDDLGYFAQGAHGLRIVDISNPDSLMPTVGQLDVGQHATDVHVNGNTAYAGTSSGIAIVDVSDPVNPMLTSSLNVGHTVGFCTAVNYLFVASEADGLVVLSTVDPVNPQYVTSIATPGTSRDIDFAGSYVFMAAGDGGLVVVDVHQPVSPAVLAQLDLGGFASSIEIASNYALVTIRDVGLAAVDISDPSNPHLVSTLTADGSSDLISIWGCYALVANATEGVRAYYIGDRTNMLEVAYSLLDGTANAVTYSGDVVFASKTGQIVAFDGSAFLGDFIENAATVHLTGTQTQVPAGGGTVVYDATVVSRCHMCHTPPYTVPGVFYRTYVQLPNNELVGPLTNQSFTLAGYMNMTVMDLTLTVPANAPSGTYTFMGEISKPPGFVPTATDVFTFTKSGNVSGSGFRFDPAEWRVAGSTALPRPADDGLAPQR